jgi:hypothetical protein
MLLAVGLRGIALLVGFQALLAAPPPKTLAQLRDEVRPVVGARCGQCHSKVSPKVMPRAFAVFDSDRQDWSARLSKAQLAFALERFKGLSMSTADMERVTALVEAELASR